MTANKNYSKKCIRIPANQVISNEIQKQLLRLGYTHIFQGENICYVVDRYLEINIYTGKMRFCACMEEDAQEISIYNIFHHMPQYQEKEFEVERMKYKKYILFGFDMHCRSGGIGDILKDMNDLRLLKRLANKEHYDYMYIIDRDTWEIEWENDQ